MAIRGNTGLIVVLALAITVHVAWLAGGPGDDLQPIRAPESSPSDPPASRVQPIESPKAPVDRGELPATPTFVLEQLTAGEAPVEDGEVDIHVITARLGWAPHGAPVLGARVTATTEPIDSLKPPPSLLEEGLPEAERDPDGSYAVTDRNGRFRLPNVPPRRDTLLQVQLADGGIDVLRLRSRPERDGESWQGEYLLRPRGSLTGTVVTAEGRPVHDVIVRAVDELQFDAGNLDPDELAERMTGLESLDPRASLMRPRLRQHLGRDLPFPATRTGRDGSFTLPGVRAGDVRLVVTHPDHGGRNERVTVIAGHRTELGLVALDPTQIHGIRLVEWATMDSEYGPPLPGVQVCVRWEGQPYGTLARTTDEEGRVWFARPMLPEQAEDFEFPSGLGRRELRRLKSEAQRWRVLRMGTPQMYAFGRRNAGAPWQLLWPAPRSRDTYTLRPVRDLTIIPRSEAGLPVADARVVLRPRISSASWRVEEDGTVTIDGLPLGPLAPHFSSDPEDRPAVIIQYPHHAPAVFAWSALDHPLFPTPWQVSLTPTFPIDVAVVDDLGEPVRGAVVEVEVGDPRPGEESQGRAWSLLGAMRLGATDASGRLHVPALWRTRARFRVRHDRLGTSDWTTIDQLRPGQRVLLEEQRIGTVHGLVFDGDLPITRRYVVEARPDRQDDRVKQHRPRGVLTRDDGSYRIDRLPAGRWILRVLDAGMQPTTRVRRGDDRVPNMVDVLPRRQVAADLSIGTPPGAGARLHGRVHGVESPHERARLLTRAFVPPWEDGLRRGVVVAPDPAGRFAFEELPARWDGRLELQLRTSAGWETQARLDELRTASRREGPLEFTIAHGALTLALFDANGKALAHRQIEFHEPAGTALVRLTDRTGTLQCDDLPAGSYRIRIRSLGGEVPDFGDELVEVRAGGHTVTERLAMPQ